MRSKRSGWILTIIITAVMMGLLMGLVGCGSQGKPEVMVFLGKSSKSYSTMKPVVDKLQKKYGKKVTWVNVDFDDPASKGEIDKYHVSMNPTVILINSQGQIKETYMGSAREDMLSAAIESYIPGTSKKQTSQPGSVTTPAAPVTPGSSIPVNVPQTSGP
jgi:thioredoxin-like negative regulator of GroEL